MYSDVIADFVCHFIVQWCLHPHKELLRVSMLMFAYLSISDEAFSAIYVCCTPCIHVQCTGA